MNMKSAMVHSPRFVFSKTLSNSCGCSHVREGERLSRFDFRRFQNYRNWGAILCWLLVFFDSARRCLGVERVRANVQEKAFKAKRHALRPGWEAGNTNGLRSRLFA
jgi:hypothetical protein